MKAHIFWPVAISIALAAPAAWGQIYRCEVDGQLTFSDIPCGDGIQPHVSTGAVSVIEASNALEQIAEDNRSFVEQRTSEIRQRREQARARRAASEAGPPSIAPPAYGHSSRRSLSAFPHRARNFNIQRPPRDNLGPAESEESFQRRNTLLSRSGSNRRKILR